MIAFQYFGPFIKITNPAPAATGEDSVYALQIGAYTYTLKFLSSKNLGRIFDFFHSCYNLLEKIAGFIYKHFLSHLFEFIFKHTKILTAEVLDYFCILFGVIFDSISKGNIYMLIHLF